MKAFKKPSSDVLKQQLSDEQYQVTQLCGTEPPFQNAFWNHHEEGIYVDVVSGEALFSSTDKFDSGTGWPSFTKPISKDHCLEKTDGSHGMKRTEVLSRQAGSHLGHVFNDGPSPTHQRYCINSASLRFVSKDQLEKEGYGEYTTLFETQKKIQNKETAILAGGCFWGVEELFRTLPGVLKTEVGYTGGHTKQPVYTQVKTGNTGHAEAIRIEFDSSKLSFEDLLRFFFSLHNPTTENRQGNDIGSQYRSAIFYENGNQKELAQKIISEAQAHWEKPIVTEVVSAHEFYTAEEYHQEYLLKNPGGYTCHFVRYDAFKK